MHLCGFFTQNNAALQYFAIVCTLSHGRYNALGVEIMF